MKMGDASMPPGERAAYANGYGDGQESMRDEVMQLRVELEIWKRNGGDFLLKAEIERLQGEIDVLLSKSKEAT